jgi:PhnB protein
MLHPIPYLSFNGNCAEAMRFYERVLDGKLELLMRTADTPMAALASKEHADRIVHARLALPGGGTVSMALQPMFWAKIWGMVTDKFGTPWIVNGELQAIYVK